MRDSFLPIDIVYKVKRNYSKKFLTRRIT